MDEAITPERVVSAAQELDQAEFTRADLAGRLNVQRPDIKEAFKAARKSGRLEKVRNDDEGTGYFRLAQ
jgi:DNA-binding transcriptional regulator LsrR (DeoR family)